MAAAAKAEGAILFTLDVELADLRRNPPGAQWGVASLRWPLTEERRFESLLLPFGPDIPWGIYQRNPDLIIRKN